MEETVVVSTETRREIERQVRVYDEAKERVIARIQDNVETAIKRLNVVERASGRGGSQVC